MTVNLYIHKETAGFRQNALNALADLLEKGGVEGDVEVWEHVVGAGVTLTASTPDGRCARVSYRPARAPQNHDVY